MKLHESLKITKKRKRRLGQGPSSGRGKTAGRGTKGQKARGKIPIAFEGGALTLLKRLPFRRGRNKNKVFKNKPIAINVKVLNLLPKNSTVDIELLVKHKLVNAAQAKMYGVKILGDGELQNPVVLKLPASKGALEKIKKAGGQVESI